LKSVTINNTKLLKLPKIHAESGNITAINNGKEVDFSIKRCYYLYDVPAGASRGGHAHKSLHQLIIAASGSFEVIIDDARHKKTISLNQPDQGLYLPPGLWRELDNFSAGSICLVLASEKYSEEDYIREYAEFRKYKRIGE
jgi:uncharacterized RmlC-like cupin family protein